MPVFTIYGQDRNQITLNLYWYTSEPFIYEDGNGSMLGIEPEMLRTFQTFLKVEKGIDVDLNWKKTTNFSKILEIVRRAENPNAIGVSALSITEKRLEYADFPDPYLPDITVLISSNGTPIVRSYEEMNDMMSSMRAITIRETKYESMLLNLKEQLGVNFTVEYIDSESNVLDGVRGANDCFGFIDLPVYMMHIENGSEVTRQNFFTVKGLGYSYIMPKGSQWKEYFNEFIAIEKYQKQISDIISSHLGEELYRFIDDIYAGEELGTSILTREKEMQLALIKNANLQLEQETATKRILIVGIAVTSVFLFAIGYLFYKNQKTTTILVGQKDQIEDQQEDIRQKNEQLMNRNAQLVALNEEKNNLVRILAHDIRSPLSQIIMVSDIVNQRMSGNLSEGEAKLLNQVTASAERINQMVTKILDVDVLEGNRIKVLQERVDIQVIMRDVGQRYRPIAAKKNIDLVVEFCENHNMIRTDHLLLLLVLENLVSNAVKFSNPESTVELRAECSYDSVIFKVSDNGPGFSDEDKKKLFNRFQKLSAKPTAGEASTGLGLSIVKKYVQDLGGKVWVESEKGNGSTFFIKLTA
ncbi:ATP-binding protein [Ekhidna sp. To15]|uniref:ATP-binding protein n=1 Tax=Ekhidna sp. To15 TaxID=3395267 RepID=UPI003F52599B